MIFLDTCVWIELLGVRTPKEKNEVLQATAATALFEDILSSDETIITCKEQMLELISAIEKVTMRTVNRTRKEKQLSGVGNLKEFRQLSEFQNTKQLCISVLEDLTQFSKVESIEVNVKNILQKLELADINDCLYYDYCSKHNVELYTFDSDINNLGYSANVHIYSKEQNQWL